MIRRRVVVRGHVQGVFFRDSVRRLAGQNGVAGWVRNRPDGAVEAVFEGESQAVRRLVDFMALGPPSARIEDVSTVEEEPDGVRGFETR